MIGGVVAVATVVTRSAPQDQTLVIRLRGGEPVSRVEGVVTREGDSEATAGFSQDFRGTAPRSVRHTFSAPNGTYIIVINLRGGVAGEQNPNQPETSFERRVSLGGGEVIVSPD